MTKEQFLKVTIFVAFAGFFTILGYRIKDTYEARMRLWKESVIIEAIASGDLIRTQAIRDSGLCKSSKYALNR